MNVFRSLRGIFNYRYSKQIFAVLVVFVVAVIIRNSNAVDSEVVAETAKPLVQVTTPLKYSDPESLSLIGSVRAFSEAQITAEVGGRITGVNVELGQTVPAGAVIATIENATERAALLQAEGAYEAAKAAAASGNVGTAEAKIRLDDSYFSLETANNSAFGTSQNILFTTLDSFFSNPNGPYPGVKIQTATENSFLRNERIALQSSLPQWQGLDFATHNLTLQRENTNYAIEQIERLINITDIFIAAVNSTNNRDSFSESERDQLNTSFNSARSQLVTARNDLESKFANVESATQNLERAQINASGNVVSTSDAQLKQALGTLRAAEANLAKTILRTPISGTVNTLTVKTGDYINASRNVAVVANNSALEIVTFVGDLELATLQVGDKVLIEEQYEGTIIQISPAVNPDTKKTEVRIATENTNIKNGDTVKITNLASRDTELREIRVPLTAVKFEIEDGFIFTLDENNTLVAKPVTLGSISGSSVVIESGLSPDDQFVVDVRGLLAGEAVEVKE